MSLFYCATNQSKEMLERKAKNSHRPFYFCLNIKILPILYLKKSILFTLILGKRGWYIILIVLSYSGSANDRSSGSGSRS